jgi:hypothetical protein
MIKTDYKSEYPIDYRLEIIEYFEKKRMVSYKKYLIKLFEVLPVRSLVHIYEKIQKQGKKPFVIEKFIDTYFDKYDIYSLISIEKNNTKQQKKPKNQKTLKEKRVKELSSSVYERVKKYRANTKKVNFQVMINPELKKQIKKYCFDNGCTYEQMLIEKLHLFD